LISLIGWGLGNSLAKKYSKSLSPSKLVVYRNLTTVCITALALSLFWSKTVFNLHYIFLGFGLAVLGYIGQFFFLKGLETGNLGLVSPISSSRIVISAIIGTTFLKDHLSGLQWFFILIIFLGVALSSIDPKNLTKSELFTLKSGVPFALLNAIIWGVVYPLYSIPSAILGAFLFSFILELTGLLLSLIQTRLNHRSIRLTKTELKENFAGLFMIGLTGGLGSVFVNLGYSTGHIGIVSAVSSAVPLIAVTYGKFIYKEQLNKRQVFAVALIIAGIVLLAYFRN
jgi:drug/metabolite transporter (DMT)-like permease